MRLPLLAGTALALCLPAATANAAWDDWNIQPLRGSFDVLEYTVGGQVNGTVFSANQPGTFNKTGGTGAATLYTSIDRNYDSGLALSLKGQFEVFHDRLSGDNYGSDFLAKLYGTAQTGLGRIDVGMADGAAYTLAVVGPVVNPEVTVDNPNATFFRDPSTGGAFISVFALNSAVESSLNYAKVSYYTPRVFGLQIGASFTPSEGKQVLPFVNMGPNVPDRQTNIWEIAANYSDTFGDFTVSGYAGLSMGHDDKRTAGHEGLTDFAFGTEVDWAINDDVKLAVGGAYRQANTYTFNIYSAFNTGRTESMHASTVLSYGSWSVGAEFGHGKADGALGAPTLSTHAYLIDAAYAVNSNLQITAGWQKLHYSQTGALFYNALPRIEMDAVFLHGVINI
ncbi:MAG: hypothetical protein JO167_14445 [Alphaproteobacteria bacterium]|nr:hypothetical protein [Alphaproteobacteria bacterium]